MSAFPSSFRFVQALNILNAVLEAHRDGPALRFLLEDAGDSPEDLRVAIYEVDPDSPHDFYTIRLQDGVFVIVDHGRGNPDDPIDWRVSTAFLNDVIRQPRKYVDSPELLNLDWLRDTAGAA